VGVCKVDLGGQGAAAVGATVGCTRRGGDVGEASVVDGAAFGGRGPEGVISTGQGDDEVELLAVAGEGEALERALIVTGRGDDEVSFYLSSVGSADGFRVDVSTGAGSDTTAGKTFVDPSSSSGSSGSSGSAPAPTGTPSFDRISMGAGDDQLGRYFCDENRDDSETVEPGSGPTSLILLGSGDDMALVDQFSPLFGGILRVNGGTGNDVMQVNVTGWDFLAEKAWRLPAVTGGRGEDQFVLERGETSARIRDFQVGTDLIALAGGVAFDDLRIGAHGRDAAVFDADGSLLALVGTRGGLDPARLTRDAFVRHDEAAFDVPPEPDRGDFTL